MNATATVSLVGVGGQGILLAAAILTERDEGEKQQRDRKRHRVELIKSGELERRVE